MYINQGPCKLDNRLADGIAQSGDIEHFGVDGSLQVKGKVLFSLVRVGIPDLQLKAWGTAGGRKRSTENPTLASVT